MSSILDSVLDDKRRAECRANDRAIAMGRPIIVSEPTLQPVRRTSSLHHHVASARSEGSGAAPADEAC